MDRGDGELQVLQYGYVPVVCKSALTDDSTVNNPVVMRCAQTLMCTSFVRVHIRPRVRGT